MQTTTRMVVIENVGTCNLRCTYCFPEHMWQREGHRGVISDETFRAAVETAFAGTTAESVDVHLAGGEPLLAGPAWLARAFATAREVAAGHGKAVTFSLQTNATVVTAEIARLLADQGVTVGVSIDGDRVINDAARGGTERTLAGFGLLREAAGGRAPGVIVTVTRCNAERLDEVVGFLDTLDVAMFRANQMGATASWNEHAAPRAHEWLAARTSILRQIASRRGRLMEYNLSQWVTKFVAAMLGHASPLTQPGGCAAMRCTAGRELLYVDREGSAYPCPRATVTPAARIGNVTDVDLVSRRTATALALDDAMRAPQECLSCPARVVCDFGCHAFNVARGNYFEVNCDATKDLLTVVKDDLEDVARVAMLVAWRARVRAEGDYAAAREGVDLPDDDVEVLVDALRTSLTRHLAEPDSDHGVWSRRYGWRTAEVPVLPLDRPRVGDRRPRTAVGAAARRGAGHADPSTD